MPSVINIQLVTDDQGGEVSRLLPYAGTSNTGREAARVLTGEIERLAAGIGRGRMRVQVDSTAGVAASITLTCTVASATAGDRIYIGGLYVVGVAGSPVASSGQYDTTAGSNDLYAASIAAAINGLNAAAFSATSSTNTVIVTARVPGTAGNAIAVSKVVTTSGTVTFTGTSLAGGVEPGTKTTQTVTCGAAGTNGQVFVIGNVTLTLAASAANENQVTNGGSANGTAVNLAAAIAAHSKLRGLFTCSTPAAGVFTITCLLGGRAGALVYCSTTITSCTLTNSGAFATTATSTRVTDGFDFAMGAP